MLNTHTQTTLVYIDDPNSTWRIAARTLLFSFLASCRYLYFFPLFYCSRHKQHHSKQAHIRFIDISRSAPDAMMTLTTRGKKSIISEQLCVKRLPRWMYTVDDLWNLHERPFYHRGREERALSSAFPGWHHGEGGGIPRPWWGLRSSSFRNSDSTAFPRSQPRPYLPFSCFFHALCKKSRAATPS